MNQVDLQHLTRLSEMACEANPDAYRRGVKWFSLLGYLWVLLCLLFGVSLLGWVASRLLQGADFKAYMIGGFFLGAGMLTAGVSALWLRLEPPEGEELTPEQAPALFRLIHKIGKKVNGPPIHHVLVDGDFNASIVQIPRWGLMGGTNTNYLVVGLPMLMAIAPERLASVLAHEYGHLREGHGSFSAWIYRSRMAWQRFYENLDDQDSVATLVNRSFIRWYFPRFMAKSFALARQDEYTADRVACQLLKADVVAAALKEIEVKAEWLHAVFWAAHWRGARTHAVPVGPMASMRHALLLQPESVFAHASLKRAWQRASSIEDTHPGLRDRLEALDPEGRADRRPPAWSRQSSLYLLGPSLPHLIQQFDREWCGIHASAWKEFHADMQRWNQRMTQLQAAAVQNLAGDWAELGDLVLRLNPHADADAAAAYGRALARDSECPEALRGMAQVSAKTSSDQSMVWSERLFGSSPKLRGWAAHHALSLLDQQEAPDEKQLANWRQRQKDADQVEQSTWEVLMHSDWLHPLAVHDLSGFDLEECTVFLGRQEPVRHAWIARKPLHDFPWRRCFLLVVDLTLLDEDEVRGYLRWLMREVPTPGPCVVAAVQLGVDIKQAPRGTLTPIK